MIQMPLDFTTLDQRLAASMEGVIDAGHARIDAAVDAVVERHSSISRQETRRMLVFANRSFGQRFHYVRERHGVQS